MNRSTPDPPTEELIWFAWPQRPGPAAHVEADDKLADLVEPPAEGDLRRTVRERRGPAVQIISGTIVMAPLGHSETHIPQPLQKSRSIS